MIPREKKVNSDIVARGREAAAFVDELSRVMVLYYEENEQYGKETGITIGEFVSLALKNGMDSKTIGYISNDRHIDMRVATDIEVVYEIEPSMFSYINVNSESNRAFRVTNATGTKGGFSLPTLSVALLAASLSDKLDWIIHNDVVITYVKILNGMRAPKGYWSSMTDHELYMIALFETLFISNIYSYEAAKDICMRDRIFCAYPLPRKNREFLSLYDCASTVVDVSVFDMGRLPRNIPTDGIFYTQAVERCLDYYQVTIDEVTIKMLKHICPAALIRIGGLKNLKEFYKNYITHFDEMMEDIKE